MIKKNVKKRKILTKTTKLTGGSSHDLTTDHKDSSSSDTEYLFYTHNLFEISPYSVS